MPGQAAPTQVGQLQLATFANPAGLQANGQNLYVETASSGAPTAIQPSAVIAPSRSRRERICPARLP